MFTVTTLKDKDKILKDYKGLRKKNIIYLKYEQLAP